MIIRREWAMPSSNTFSILPIKKLIEQYIDGAGVIVDPFANKATYGTLRNDLNPEFDTEYHLDALEFLKLVESDYADVVLFDPPYSLTKANQLYKKFGGDKLEVSVSNMKYWSLCKDNISRIIRVGGIAISFGWNSNGIGKGRGMEILEVLVVAHGGSRNDTIVTVERKVSNEEM